MHQSKHSKKRLAFLGAGAHTLPSYRALLERLALTYDVTVFFEIHQEVKGTAYEVKTVAPNLRNRRWREFRFFWLLLIDFLKQRYDIIHCHSAFPTGLCGILLGQIYRIPVVVSLDSAEATVLRDIKFGDLMSSRRQRINKWVIERADVTIALTTFLKNEVATNLQVIREIEVIPRGVDTKRFSFRQRQFETPLTFLNVGYLNEIKDPKMLLEAFSIIRSSVEARLVQVGRDYSDGKYLELSRDLGISQYVQFVGYVSNDILPRYYEDADILLHTSRYESQAVVVNEALASGLLICGSHVGLLADLSSICCTTVRPRAAEELANAVLKLLTDKQKIRSLVKNGYEWASKYDLQWTLDQHIRIYEKLLSKLK